MSYVFRLAVRADLPMLRGWLETLEVRRWWGDPDEQFAFASRAVGPAPLFPASAPGTGPALPGEPGGLQSLAHTTRSGPI